MNEKTYSTYSINEIFYSLQGEGFYAGTPAVFIRFAGCNLSCPFCDTDFHKGKKMTLEQIVGAIEEAVGSRPFPNLVVLTGGEPTLQANDRLCDILHSHFDVVAMESNGTREAPRKVDFLTISPKSDFLPQPTHNPVIVKRCEELKVVFDGKNDPGHWQYVIAARHYYLQPCDTGDAEKNAEIMQGAVEYILKHPQWKLSLQTQKILNIR